MLGFLTLCNTYHLLQDSTQLICMYQCHITQQSERNVCCIVHFSVFFPCQFPLNFPLPFLFIIYICNCALSVSVAYWDTVCVKDTIQNKALYHKVLFLNVRHIGH